MAGNCPMHERIEEDIKKLNDEVANLSEKISDTSNISNSNDEKIKVANNRIKDLEIDNKSFTELVTSVKVLATEVKHMVEKLNDHEGRLGNIEKQPGEYWRYLMICVIGGVVGYGFSLL